MHTISIKHNFESSHRLTTDASLKCQSIHGHSWWVTVKVGANHLDHRDMLVPYGDLKKAIRKFIDDQIDHGIMLNAQDPLVEILRAFGSQKIFLVFGDPTTENIAMMLHRRVSDIIRGIPEAEGVEVVSVDLQETHVNFASYTPPAPFDH